MAAAEPVETVVPGPTLAPAATVAVATPAATPRFASRVASVVFGPRQEVVQPIQTQAVRVASVAKPVAGKAAAPDRTSTRLNSSTNAQLVCRPLLTTQKTKTTHNAHNTSVS